MRERFDERILSLSSWGAPPLPEKSRPLFCARKVLRNYVHAKCAQKKKRRKVSNQNLSFISLFLRVALSYVARMRRNTFKEALTLSLRFENGCWGFRGGKTTGFVVSSSSFANYHHRRSVFVAKKRLTTCTKTTRRGNFGDDLQREKQLRERWTVAYAVAVRDAFQAKTSKCEEEPALRAVLEVKEPLEKETKKEDGLVKFLHSKMFYQKR